MSELLDKKPPEPEVHGNFNSDSEQDIDSDGYDKNDPYASTAKRIDERNKMVEAFHERPMQKMTKAIVDNKANMTYFEKHLLKYVVLVGLLVWLIYSNLQSQEESLSRRGMADGA